jgi:hypothetical protein
MKQKPCKEWEIKTLSTNRRDVVMRAINSKLLEGFIMSVGPVLAIWWKISKRVVLVRHLPSLGHWVQWRI